MSQQGAPWRFCRSVDNFACSTHYEGVVDDSLADPPLPPTLPALARWQTAANQRGEWRDAVSDDSVVLHYAYSYPEEVAAKAHRSCPDSYLEAARRGDKAKVGVWAGWGAGCRLGVQQVRNMADVVWLGSSPAAPSRPATAAADCARAATTRTPAQVKECFVIEFDQDAYMAAAQGPAAARDFFNSRMVLGEGARVRCTDPDLGQQVRGAGCLGICCDCWECCLHNRLLSLGCRWPGTQPPTAFPRACCLALLREVQGWCTLTNIERFKFLLEKVGLYRRLSAPQALLRQHERQIQRRLRAGQAVELNS